jgi:hypothetical protein
MNKNKPTILWEKYKDPWNLFNNEDEDGWETEDYNNVHNVATKLDDAKAIVTPMGPVPFSPANCPSNTFNFWLGHSNFRITNKIAEMISQQNGIESVDIFSPHRIRIGVGKLFKPCDVMTNICQCVGKYILDRNKKDAESSAS